MFDRLRRRYYPTVRQSRLKQRAQRGAAESSAVRCRPPSLQKAGDFKKASDWIVRLFRVSDSEIQGLLLDRLNNIEELVAVGRLIGPHLYVAVETMDAAQAAASQRLIFSLDPDARVMDTAIRHRGANS